MKYYEGESLSDEFRKVTISIVLCNEIIILDVLFSPQLNPQKELPVLDDNGFLLSEHVAILQVNVKRF